MDLLTFFIISVTIVVVAVPEGMGRKGGREGEMERREGEKERDEGKKGEGEGRRGDILSATHSLIF